VKLSQKNKNEEKLKSKIKRLEGVLKKKNEEIMQLFEKIEGLEGKNKEIEKG